MLILEFPRSLHLDELSRRYNRILKIWLPSSTPLAGVPPRDASPFMLLEEFDATELSGEFLSMPFFWRKRPKVEDKLLSD